MEMNEAFLEQPKIISKLRYIYLIGEKFQELSPDKRETEIKTMPSG